MGTGIKRYYASKDGKIVCLMSIECGYKSRLENLFSNKITIRTYLSHEHTHTDNLS